jgi:hypothetical protein
MSGSERHHGLTTKASTAAQLLSFALVAMIVAAPIASSWHELTVRHVRCAEHGELTHVPASQGLAPAPARDVASAEGQATDVADGHDHCANGFLVRGRLHVSVIRTLVRFTPPPAVARQVRELTVSPGRAFVLASAPKTSPPSA